MAYCSKCGKEIHDEAVVCVHCGCKIKNESFLETDDGKNVVRFCLTFFFGFIGSFIINHTSLKPNGWKSRTCSYFFLTYLTFGIYPLVTSLCNFSFNANKSSNIGYFKD
jgi:hypothetical protein